jgi:hypothetical protein
VSPKRAAAADLPPRIDLFARLLCVLLGIALGAVAAAAWRSGGHAALYWLCGAGALLLLVAGTVGPQRLRVGLLHLLPWA